MAWQGARFGEAELKQLMLALAGLHFLRSTGPHPTYQPSQGQGKIKEKQQQRQRHMQP